MKRSPCVNARTHTSSDSAATDAPRSASTTASSQPRRPVVHGRARERMRKGDAAAVVARDHDHHERFGHELARRDQQCAHGRLVGRMGVVDDNHAGREGVAGGGAPPPRRRI
jgi:hypothetical protein